MNIPEHPVKLLSGVNKIYEQAPIRDLASFEKEKYLAKSLILGRNTGKVPTPLNRLPSVAKLNLTQ